MNAGKFLTTSARRVYPQAPGGQAVLLAFAQRAEIARALKRNELILVPVVGERVMDTQAGKAEIAPSLRAHRSRAEVEPVAAVGNVAHALGGHLMDAHRLAVELAQVKKHRLEGQLCVTPQRLGRLKSQLAEIVVVELG